MADKNNQDLSKGKNNFPDLVKEMLEEKKNSYVNADGHDVGPEYKSYAEQLSACVGSRRSTRSGFPAGRSGSSI